VDTTDRSGNGSESSTLRISRQQGDLNSRGKGGMLQRMGA
jgi:hypothetical protein